MVAARLLSKYGKKTTADVTAELLTEVASAFGAEISVDSAEQLAASIREDSEEKIADWVLRPENTDRLKKLALEKRDPLPGNDHSIVVCPHCQNFVSLSD